MLLSLTGMGIKNNEMGVLHGNSKAIKNMTNMNKQNRKSDEKTLHYRNFSQRLDEDNHEWLREENEKYGSWNKFFKEIKRRYFNENTKKL
jgi:hypothetical protein